MVTFGLDLSFAKPPAWWWQARRAEGYEIVFQDVWTGGYTLRNAEENLRLAREAGFLTGIYICLSDWMWPNHQMDMGIQSIGPEFEHVSCIALDLELPLTNPELYIQEALTYLWSFGKPIIIYSATWAYEKYFHGVQAGFNQYPLWYANYNGLIDIQRPYWAGHDVIAHQFAGTTDLDGHDVDLNVFDSNWIAGLKEGSTTDMTPQQAEEMLTLLREIKDNTLWVKNAVAHDANPESPEWDNMYNLTAEMRDTLREIAGSDKKVLVIQLGDVAE